MQKQLGKIGAVRREVQGKPCPFCGGYTYQLVLRTSSSTEEAGVFARCSSCQHPRRFNEDFWQVLWM
jgi:hypothetical protein